MGNVFLCHHQQRQLSTQDEISVSSEIEPDSSHESSVPCIAIIRGADAFAQKNERRAEQMTLNLSSFPSSDIAKLINLSGDNLSTGSSPDNLFSSKRVGGLTPWTTNPTSVRNTWRNTETWTQHEKWLHFSSPSLILPTLFLGSKKDSLRVERLKELQITHILSVMSGKRNLVSDFKWLSVPMADTGNTCLDDVMNRSFDFVRESQKDKNKILIHCHLGQNRSATVVIAWLMTEFHVSMHHAYRFVKEKRHLIHPNNLYIQQLREYDKRLFGVYSVKPNFLSVSYEDGEVKVEEEDWSENQSREYKKKQEKESSQRFESRLPSKVISLNETTCGSSSLFQMMTSVQDEEVVDIIYPSPLESFVNEASSDNESAISPKEK